MEEMQKKPQWLKIKLPDSVTFQQTDLLIDKANTICRSARCPNIFECWQKKQATFLLLGSVCTRNCLFCNVKHGQPEEINNHEIEKIIDLIKKNQVRYIVLTSVTRDDLADGGADYFCFAVKRIREECPGLKIELLIPDFQAKVSSLNKILSVDTDLIAHNLETVKEIYPLINRKQENYQKSLNVLSFFSENKKITKSGFMLGLGETPGQIQELLHDLKKSGVKIITIGQYLRPSLANISVARYYTPEEFEEIGTIARKMGFHVVSAPLVRSSYKAEELYQAALKTQNEISDLQ